MKGIDIYEAAALGCIPENGYILCGRFTPGGNVLYDVVIYNGLMGTEEGKGTLSLEFSSCTVITLEPEAEGKIRKTRKNITEPFRYEAAPQLGKNFALLFPAGEDTEKLIEHFMHKELKYTRP